jgi:competence ComEA-like helix-hairpin-helix protein
MDPKRPLRNVFYFSKVERNGIILLVVVMFATVGFRFVLLQKEKPPIQITITPLHWTEDTAIKDAHIRYSTYPIIPNKEFMTFDPNLVSEETLQKMPFSAVQIKSLIRYRNTGAKFRLKKDLLKIYHMDRSTFSKAEPYIALPEKMVDPKAPQPANDEKKDRRPKQKLDINRADSAALESLPGIGPYLAASIVQYRHRLGGFARLDQLLEIRNFRPEILTQINRHIELLACPNCKINVNKSDAKQLGRHPYIGYALANRMVQYRQQHGPYRAIDDLLKVAGMDRKIMDQIAEHIIVE